MSTTTTSLINCNFGGIARKDSCFSENLITCSDCQNVELFKTTLNSGVGIRTSKGNVAITDLIPSDEQVIGIFESIQDGETLFMVYTESTSQGRLYNLDLLTNTLTLLIDGLNVTGKACACDFTQGWLDMFVFSNGKDIKYVYSNTETHEKLLVEKDSNITLKDQDGRNVKGLGLVVFDARVWVFDGRVLWYSQQGECRNFKYNDANITTSAGYIEFVKNITAIYLYLGSLAVFHKDSSVLVTLDATTGFKQDQESPGGCAGYNTLIYHDTDLYFYDDTKKGVFSFQQVVSGEKTLGKNNAEDIQEELNQIKSGDLSKIRAQSVVTADRNEVWFLIPISNDENHSIIMIYDYLRDAWIKRKSQKINAIGVVDSVVYSGGKTIYEEYVGEDFNGEFIESYYTCTTFNLGSDNTLKITKFPPRATLESSLKSNFAVKYVKNYNPLKAIKTKFLRGKSYAAFLRYDSDCKYDTSWIYQTNINAILKLPSSTFKALEITFYTESLGQSFAIKALEFSKIKVKQV